MRDTTRIEKLLQNVFGLQPGSIKCGKEVYIDDERGIPYTELLVNDIKIGEKCYLDVFEDYFLYENVDVSSWNGWDRDGVYDIREEFYATLGKIGMNIAFVRGNSGRR